MPFPYPPNALPVIFIIMTEIKHMWPSLRIKVHRYLTNKHFSVLISNIEEIPKLNDNIPFSSLYYILLPQYFWVKIKHLE